MRFDIVIKNGSVIDGTGIPKYRADIAISDGRIVGIGKFDEIEAREVIDAEGRVVAPGFIDPHTHYDAQVFWDPTCADSGQNGATTVIAGNCGFGFAPCRPKDRERYMMMMETTEQIPGSQMRKALPWTWETFPELVSALKAAPKAVNLAMYVPLNPLMIYVMGIDAAKSRRPTAQEMAEMKRLLNQGLDAGALGLSFVRLGAFDSHTDYDGSPMPSDLIDPEDAAELSTVLGQRNEGVVMCFTQIGKDGDPKISERIARAAGRPIIHNLLNVSEDTPEMHRQAMYWLSELNESGLSVYAQSVLNRSWQEYTLWTMDGSALDFIETARELTLCRTPEEKLAKAADREYRKRLAADYDPLVLETLGGGLETYVVTSMGDRLELAGYVGKSFGEISEAEGKHVTEAWLDLALLSSLDLTYRTAGVTGTDAIKVTELMSHPHVLPGLSDGGAHSKINSSGCWTTDLLIWLVRESKTVTQEEMHYRLSYLPARVFGLKDRGAVMEGYYADLVIYDIDDLYYDRSGYEIANDMPGGDWRRKAKAGGYSWILVNGEVTYENDVRRESIPGRFVQVCRPVEEHKQFSVVA